MSGHTQKLCTSCDQCRARKTKCDGKRPCFNCVFKFLKTNNLDRIEGIDPADILCTYRPAKRRGPTPGRPTLKENTLTTLSSDNVITTTNDDMMNNLLNINRLQKQLINMHDLSNAISKGNDGNQQQVVLQQPSILNFCGIVNLTSIDGNNQVNTFPQNQQLASGVLLVGGGGGNGNPIEMKSSSSAPHSMQNHLGTVQEQIQQLQDQLQVALQFQMQLQVAQNFQQELQLTHQQLQVQPNFSNESIMSSDMTTFKLQVNEEFQKQHVKVETDMKADIEKPQIQSSIPQTIASNKHMLDPGDSDGSRFLAYYHLSIDELFRLPSTPSDDEYCANTGQDFVGSHIAILSAARFAELALGAFVNDEVPIAIELHNASVNCIREASLDEIDSTLIYDIAKTYFLLCIFRSIRGDMTRFFKYRRIALSYVEKLQDDSNSQTLLAALTFLDTRSYMVYNSRESDIPNVHTSIPIMQKSMTNNNEVDKIVKTDTALISSDPKNKNWILGAPLLYLNNEAPLNARVLDAASCIVRICCDYANSRFAANTDESTDNSEAESTVDGCITPTITAVMSVGVEFCSRNVVLSSFSLMQQDEANKLGAGKNEGQHLIISALDAFLEDGGSASEIGFTDNQIQSLFSVCNTVLENPFILHHAGPTNHVVTNASILLCHLLNRLHAMKKTNRFGATESALFEEAFSTLISTRKLLVKHRSRIPGRLRCHELPRVPVGGVNVDVGDDQPFIDLDKIFLCSCRGCQEFVFLACSPCVATERARARAAVDTTVDPDEEDDDDNDVRDRRSRVRNDVYTDNEYDLDDDALFGMFEHLIST